MGFSEGMNCEHQPKWVNQQLLKICNGFSTNMFRYLITKIYLVILQFVNTFYVCNRRTWLKSKISLNQTENVNCKLTLISCKFTFFKQHSLFDIKVFYSRSVFTSCFPLWSINNKVIKIGRYNTYSSVPNYKGGQISPPILLYYVRFL